MVFYFNWHCSEISIVQSIIWKKIEHGVGIIEDKAKSLVVGFKAKYPLVGPRPIGGIGRIELDVGIF